MAMIYITIDVFSLFQDVKDGILRLCDKHSLDPKDYEHCGATDAGAEASPSGESGEDKSLEDVEGVLEEEEDVEDEEVKEQATAEARANIAALKV